jgi:hypothetical protein
VPSVIGPEPMSLMPYWVTICLAVAVAFLMSSPAPVVMSPILSSSATRPPSITASRSISSREMRYLSSVGSCIVKPSACPRGMIVTLCTGSAFGSACPTMAWPPSW